MVNASVSGETTSGGLQRLPRALELNKPQILVLELGANDALRGLPLSAAKDNLAKMVELGTKAGARVLLVGMRIPPNYGPRYTADFTQMYSDITQRYHLALVPFSARIGGAGTVHGCRRMACIRMRRVSRRYLIRSGRSSCRCWRNVVEGD